MSNSQIFDLEILLSNFPKSRYFIDVINTSTMEVGLLNLKKDQEDPTTACHRRNLLRH
jgi:hypothetical protein